MQNAARLLGLVWLVGALGFMAWPVAYNDSLKEPLATETSVPALPIQSLLTTQKSYSAQAAHALVIDNATHKLKWAVTCQNGNCQPTTTFAQTRWEPGSVIKPILIALLLDHGVIQENSQFSDKGYVVTDHYRIDNHIPDNGAHYDIDAFLGTSRNTGAVQILHRLGGYSDSAMQRWHDMLTRVVGPAGYVPNFWQLPDKNYRYDESSFGVGVTLTPYRLAQIYAAFSNDGQDCTPTAGCRQLFSTGAAAYIHQELANVAHNFPGQKAADTRCNTGGKSGTALSAQPGGSYIDPVSNGVYVGYVKALASQKSYTLLVKMDEPNYDPASYVARSAWVQLADNLCSELVR